MSKLITLTRNGSTMLHPEDFTMTKKIECVLHMEVLQDEVTLKGEDEVAAELGKQLINQIKERGG